ncbi:alpha/beta hydrolase [Allohahella marinimesophila]|uniref:AB hydrolase-1 domain-containing protein n=1 Tax=Allohahella marinimesophila TaxID=1054972 RepID=A0ABP7PIS1_9GAMM
MSYKLGQFVWAILMLIGRKASRLALRSGSIGGRAYTYLVTETPDPELETLVLLHGFTGSKDSWLALVKQLRGHFNVLVIDLPGHGGSHFDPAQDFYKQSVSIIDDMLWFHKSDRVHLLGASIGASVACAYAESSPQRVHTLIMVGPAGVPVEKASEFYAEVDQGRNPYWIHTRQAWKHLLRLALKKPPPDFWPVSAYLFGDYMRRQSTYRLIWDQIIDEHQRIRPLDLVAVSALPCRKILVWGEAERTFHHATVGVLNEHLPELRVFRCEDGGHAVQCDQPKWLANLLRAEVTMPPRTPPLP